MAEIKLPFEVKRLICDHVDLPTLKSLRLVSQDWAAVGIELLLLPTFVVKSSAIDISRLMSIGSHPAVARQAARTVRAINFWSNDWDAVYLRSIVCCRHVHLRNYEVVDFVPTRDEQEALEELDALIQQRNLDKMQGESTELLTEALKHVPRLETLHISCPNPFTHPMLRKVWEEYNLETYRQQFLFAGPNRLRNIFFAAKEAGLTIANFQHDQFNSNFIFEDFGTAIPWRFPSHVNALRSLNLSINDVYHSHTSLEFAFENESNAEETWSFNMYPRNRMSVPHALESLSIKFESLERLRLGFLPTPAIGLHTLSLVGICLSPLSFLTFLTSHAPVLRRLYLGSAELQNSHFINDNTYDWHSFLSDLRDAIGHGSQTPDQNQTLTLTQKPKQNQDQNQKQSRLEKFQLSGVIKSPLPNGQTWMMWPIYRTSEEEWEVIPGRKATEKTREIERFVVDGGEWPMGAEDDISSLIT
ncbi:hypothetical protein DL95DRAFT_380393 [Leptodontidium sp. 2 PMI_412]|nr:hypothetical protein DL95DRAFT_380393 [Leptodontidium sp. 2 PMI_412]